MSICVNVYILYIYIFRYFSFFLQVQLSFFIVSSVFVVPFFSRKFMLPVDEINTNTELFFF